MKKQGKKFNLAKWLTIIAIASSPICGMAQLVAGNASMPVNYNSCKYIIDEPENSGGYAYSADCKTVYVLKPKIGASRVRLSLNQSVLKDMCPATENMRKAHRSLVQQHEKVSTLLYNLEPIQKNEIEIARLKKYRNELIAELRDYKDPFDRYEGGKAAVSFNANVTQDLINQFYLLNKNVVRDHQIKFEPIRSHIGYLSFTEYDSSPFSMPSSLYATFTGIKVPGQPNVFKVQDSTSGQIVFSLARGCNIWEEQIKNSSSTAEAGLNAALSAELAPTLSYTYPVQSTISYLGVLDFSQAVKTLYENKELKTNFTVEQMLHQYINGGSATGLDIQINLGDLGDRFTSEQERKNFMGELRQEIATRLLTQFVDQVSSMTGLLTFQDADKNMTAPPPGHVDKQVGTETVCTSKRFAGVRYRKNCAQRAVIHRIPVAGELEQFITKSKELNLTFRESMTVSENVPMSANTTF
jgi:hypothetical protein